MFAPSVSAASGHALPLQTPQRQPAFLALVGALAEASHTICVPLVYRESGLQRSVHW